jgi:hypothetical protein
MAKKSRASPNKKEVEDDLKSQNILKNPNAETCKFSDHEIQLISPCFPQNTVFRPFDASARSDCTSDTWVCFPALPFQIGFSYPFPDFTQEFFTFTGMCYSQAMPMIWRVLFTIEEILQKKRLKFGIDELSCLYTLTTFGSKRYLFKSKAHQAVPILKVTHNDPLWKNQFFFVKRDSIPDGNDLPSAWISDGRI